MDLEHYRPQSCLVTQVTRVEQPRYPVIDAHNHLGEEFGGGWIHRPLTELLSRLDEAGVRHYVDLDGGWGEETLAEHLRRLEPSLGERFSVFGGVAWERWPELGSRFGVWAAGRLRAQAARGAAGLKIWKGLGLTVHDPQGKLAAVDDPRLDEIWETAAELGWPVMVHVGDPAAFFLPLDESNERWEELHAHPGWHFPAPPYPAFAAVMEQLAGLVARHPRTTFIGAHVGCCAENLAWVGGMLDRFPNYFIDISARTGELGRQPYSARRFFLKYTGRILFGLDLGPDVEAYRLQYRFLETGDEYFNYNTGAVPRQGRWHVCGLFLPDDVLQKVYHQNAERILFRPPVHPKGN